MQHRLSNKNKEEMTADCAACGDNVKMRLNYRGYVQCYNKWLLDSRKSGRAQRSKKKWHDEVPYQAYVTKFMKAQKGRCAICKIDFNEKSPALDHCHETGKVRGLLCTNCNLALGLVKDNVNILKSAIEYLS